MSDAMTGLFGPAPWQVQQQRYDQDAERAAQYAQMNATQRGVMGLHQAGAGLGRIGAGMMGMVDPAQKQAEMQQAIMSSGSMDTPKGMRELALKFNENKMPQQAAMLMQKARDLEAAQSKAGLEAVKTGAAISKDLADTAHTNAKTADIGNTNETKFIDAMLKEPEGSPKRIAMENALKQKGMEVSKVGVAGKPGYIQPVIVDKVTGKTTPFGDPIQDKSGVSVSVNTGIGKDLSKEVGGLLKDSKIALEGSAKMASAAERIDQALASGNVLTGPGAEKVMTVKQFFDRSGGDSGGVIAQTRQAMQALAEMNLQSRKQLQGQGQVTESEAAAAAKAMGGDINSLTVEEMRQVSSYTKKMFKEAAKEHERMLSHARTIPSAKDLIPFYEVGAANRVLNEPPAKTKRFNAQSGKWEES